MDEKIFWWNLQESRKQTSIWLTTQSFSSVIFSIPWYSNITALEQEIPVKEDEGEASWFYY